MDYLTVDQVAEELDRDVQLVRRWIREGRLEAEQLGPIYVVRRAVLAKFKTPEARPRLVRWMRMTSKSAYHAIRRMNETIDAGRGLCGEWVEGNADSDDAWMRSQRPATACKKCLALLEAKR